MKFKGLFSLVVGSCMIILWCMLLFTGKVSELTTEPYRIMTHLLSELITALLLITGGISVFKTKKNTILLNVSFGALVYSVLTAGGYYLQKGEAAMVVMFGVFTVLTTIFIIDSVTNKQL